MDKMGIIEDFKYMAKALTREAGGTKNLLKIYVIAHSFVFGMMLENFGGYSGFGTFRLWLFLGIYTFIVIKLINKLKEDKR